MQAGGQRLRELVGLLLVRHAQGVQVLLQWARHESKRNAMGGLGERGSLVNKATID